jgi:Zn-dependent protease
MSQSFLLPFIQQIALLFPTFVILFTVRGFFQALFARIAGDNTASYSGFLTLNPLAHVEVGGSFILSCLFAALQRAEQAGGGLLFALIFLAVIFIGVRPYVPVPVVPDNFRSERWGLLLFALSGFTGYCLLALLSMYIIWYGFWLVGNQSPAFVVIQQVCASIIDWSMFWAVISILPIPPFDGGAFLPALFGRWGQEMYDTLEQYALFIFLGLFFIPGVSGAFLSLISTMRAVLYQLLMYAVW